MAIVRSGRTADFLFKIDGLPPDKLRVTAFEGTEGVSQIFRYSISIASPDHALDLQGVLRKKAALTIHGPAGKRFVNGIVSRFEHISKGKKFSTYEAELVPAVWTLCLRHDCRIFQKKKVDAIVTEVLKAGGLVQGTDFEMSLRGTYPEREYCVQYRETDLDFVCRLLEDEGIQFHFVQDEKGHKFVASDAQDWAVIPGSPKEVWYQPATGGLEPKEEQVTAFRFGQQVRSGKASLRDWNYEKTEVDLLKDKQSSTFTDLEVYDYPGGHLTPEEGTRLAEARLQAQIAEQAFARGESSCRRFVPGHVFKLEDFPRKELCQDYKILRLRQRASQPEVLEEEAPAGESASYMNWFEAIPTASVFRPERATPRPSVRGPQPAIVVGAKDEKVYMDESGRVKVQFIWDRVGKKDENSTCWLRVAEMYAGADHGSQFPPLVGDEVLVDFLEGDPDRPLVVGSVYNGTNKAWLKPEDLVRNVIRTPYQHTLLFDDPKAYLILGTGNGNHIRMGDPKNDEGTDVDKDYANNIKIATKDGHFIQIAKGDKHKGFMAQTEAKHMIEMRDDPDPGIFIVDKDGKLYLHLDTKNKTINLINDQPQGEINIKCPQGTINIVATDIKVDAKNKTDIKGGAEASVKAPQVKVDGDATVAVKAGAQLTMEGSAQASLKGAMTTIEGSAMAELKGGGMTNISGGLVKIN